MKTDSFFHRFFAEFLGAFFKLIGEDERKAERYEFTSVEVKEQAFRFDGVVKPNTREDPLYFFEAQFKKESDFYLRFFGEAAVYLRQQQPENHWQAIVLFPTPEFDPGVHRHYQEFFESGRIKRLYLTSLPEEILEVFPLNLLRIIIEPEEKVLLTAEKIIRKMPDHIRDAKEQEIFIELLINLLLSKFPQMSREEIEKMFEPFLSDVKKSRAYREIADEGKKEEKRDITKAMLKKNFNFELISEITGLSQEEILAISQESSNGKN